jgi:hypothetical protein
VLPTGRVTVGHSTQTLRHSIGATRIGSRTGPRDGQRAGLVFETGARAKFPPLLHLGALRARHRCRPRQGVTAEQGEDGGSGAALSTQPRDGLPPRITPAAGRLPRGIFLRRAGAPAQNK